MSIETKKTEYLPAIVREYNLILKRNSKQSRSKRDFMVALAEALVKKGQLVKKENGEMEVA
jgi:hypothetical protein